MKKIFNVIAGPSGVGKSTCAKALLLLDSRYAFSVSATNRKPRTTEIDGKDYYFFSLEEMKKKIANNEFVEYQEVYPGMFYGTLWSELDRIRNLGKIGIFDIDVEGAINIKKRFRRETHASFLTATEVELESRLRERNTEDVSAFAKRLAKASRELRRGHEMVSYFDLIFPTIEGHPELTLEAVRNEHLRIHGSH